jgi:glycosyltransferase involved in cell wall biosynthesis
MSDARTAGMRIWIDVEDLFQYGVSGVARPSGVQRVVYELGRALQARRGADEWVGFVRHDALLASFAAVTWDEAATLFEVLTNAPAPPARRTRRDIAEDSAPRRACKRLLYRVPEPLRRPLIRLARAELDALAATVELARGLGTIGKRRRKVHPPRGQDFAQVVRPGDIFLAIGASWGHPDYPALLRMLRRRHGVHTALLLYDIIPAVHPEWCEAGLVRLFRPWLDGVLPACATLMTISRATANDVEALAKRRGIALNGPVHVVPLGSGFGEPPSGAAAPPARPLPSSGTYALFVSTIEARKNHVLLLRVWQRLLDDMPSDAVPTLVFAGRVGWLVRDLMQQLDNTAWLDGRIVLVEDPTDPELAALYRGCLFTLFPSLYEGWGLPVTESLAFGKPCLASNATAVPEAGGTLARYFDPENVAEATRVIRATIDDRAGLAAWEERVRREFRPVPWAEAADTLIATLRQSVAAVC